MNKENNEIEKILDDTDTADEIIDEDALLAELGGKKAKKPKKAKKDKPARNKRRLRYRAGFTATIVIAVVAVILLNVIVGVVADRFPITWDISKDKIFSLSEQSIEIAERVTEDVSLVIFADEDTFSSPNTGIDELDTTLREFYNALKQYNTYSGGKITYTFIDPNQEPAKYAAYSDYEVEAGDMLFLSGDRSKVRTVYDGSYSNDLYLLDTTYYYTYGYYTFESYAEKMLASSIYAISGGEEHIVQVLTGHEEDTYAIEGLRYLYELNGYTFEELVITGSADFNENANIMLIAAPETDYSSAELERIQAWVYNDGNYGRQLMVYVSPTADCPNLYEFLEVEYQITVTDELILETDFNRIQNYNYLYAMADVASTDYSATSAGTANVFTPNVRRLTTTLPSSIDTIGSYAIQLTQYPDTAKLSKLADLIGGESTEDASYTAPEDEYPLTGMIVHAIDSYNNDTGTAVDGRILVSGCPAMAYQSYVQNSSMKNEELLLDVANTMTGIENAITISGKTIESETVDYTNAAQLIIGLGIFTIGLPVIVLIVCLIVFLRRKNL